MNTTNESVRITLRIPGAWSHPEELLQRLPAGFRLTRDTLHLPDGAAIELIPLPPDDQFAWVFATACRRRATDEERATVGRYTTNIALNGPGGSMEAALSMLQAGAAIVRAGGAGVFIDNSALAHGGSDWLEMAKDGSSDAVSFAFVSIVHGDRDLSTLGMHVMGYPEIVLQRSDLDEDTETVIEVIRYICQGNKAIEDGHVLCDEHSPRFLVAGTSSDDQDTESPLHNPFGRLRLTRVRDIAEGN